MKIKIQNLLEMYKHESIHLQLTKSKNEFGQTVFESMQELVRTALNSKVVPGKVILDDQAINIEEAGTIYIGDIHGSLSAFLNILKASKLIDNEGNWIGGNKTLVQVGDLIDRGRHSWETLVYLRCLQLQAKEAGGNVVSLMGNHEQAVIFEQEIYPQDFYFCEFDTERKTVTIPGGKQVTIFPSVPKQGVSTEATLKNEFLALKEFLREDIKSGRMQLAYSDKERNFLAVHAGMEKKVLKEFIIEKLFNESSLRDTLLFLRRTEKVSSEELYKIMSDNNYSIDDLKDWLNSKLLRHVFAGIKLNIYDIVLGINSGVIWSRKKCLGLQGEAPKDLLGKTKKHKPLIVVGHTPMDSHPYNRLSETQGDCAKKMHNTFYIDTGISDEDTLSLSFNAVLNSENGGGKFSSFCYAGDTWKGRILLELDCKEKALDAKVPDTSAKEVDYPQYKPAACQTYNYREGAMNYRANHSGSSAPDKTVDSRCLYRHCNGPVIIHE